MLPRFPFPLRRFPAHRPRPGFTCTDRRPYRRGGGGLHLRFVVHGIVSWLITSCLLNFFRSISRVHGVLLRALSHTNPLLPYGMAACIHPRQ